METAALIVTIVASVIGGTWVLSAKLSSISSAIAVLGERLKQHDADIIELKGRHRQPRRRQ